MLRRLLCRVSGHKDVVFETNMARMTGRYRCTRCQITSNDFLLVGDVPSQ